MGTLVYGAAAYEFDDRTLSHVKIAVATRLRRRESFLLQWRTDGDGPGRVSLWIRQELPLAFRFNGGKRPKLNEQWLNELVGSSMSTGRMVIMSEHAANARLQTGASTRPELI